MPRYRLFVILAGGLAGCSLLTNLDGFSSKDDAPADGGGADAPVVVTDGGATDAAEGEAPPCDAAFCDDFDRASLSSRWTRSLQGGSVTLDDVAFSPPHSFRAELRPGETQGQAVVFWRSDPLPKALRCQYRLQAIRTTTSAQLSAFAVIGPGIDFYTIFLSSDPDASRVIVNVKYDDGGTFYQASAPQPVIPTESWVDVAITADWEVRRLSAEMNGKSIATEIPIPGVRSGHVDAHLGITWQEEEGDSAYRFDDYLCTVVR